MPTFDPKRFRPLRSKSEEALGREIEKLTAERRAFAREHRWFSEDALAFNDRLFEQGRAAFAFQAGQLAENYLESPSDPGVAELALAYIFTLPAFREAVKAEIKRSGGPLWSIAKDDYEQKLADLDQQIADRQAEIRRREIEERRQRVEGELEELARTVSS